MEPKEGQRLAAARGPDATPDARSERAQLQAALARARDQLAELAQAAAELETTVPARIESAIHESLAAHMLPAARQLAEVRGLSGQTIRRLERLQGDLEAEHRARVEDLSVLVDLVASGWRAVEHRLERVERALDRLEGSLGERPEAPLYRLDERRSEAG